MNLDAIYDILVTECGAAPDEREAFKRQWPACREWRFRGTLGMGGKIWYAINSGRVYVTCYQEDETPERKAVIERANTSLSEVA